MKSFICLISLIFYSNIMALCVHEKMFLGNEIKNESFPHLANSFISIDNKFTPLLGFKRNKLIDTKKYLIQYIPKDHNFRDNIQEGIAYYTYEDMESFLNKMKAKIAKQEYIIEVIGKSIENNKLHVIYPKTIDLNKKTIIMLGRQHGDESSQNWIIEGFLNEVFSTNPQWLNKFQVIIYPMINPDGAIANTRYNANSYDLNRSWGKVPSLAKDEAKLVLSHLYELNFSKLNNSLFIDMHGSFIKDFMYRVKKSFLNLDFYELQQNFIDQLGKYDPYQNGSYELSNGSPNMARIIMVQDFKINALTHETPRTMMKSDSFYRSLEELKNQGVALATTITETL